MYTVNYYKLGNKWFLDFPEYLDQGGDPENLERIGSFYDFLEIAAEGETTVVFQMDIQPFENADVMTLIGSSGERTGGYYLLETYEDRLVHLELWMNAVIYTGQRELPSNIYLKKVST